MKRTKEIKRKPGVITGLMVFLTLVLAACSQSVMAQDANEGALPVTGAHTQEATESTLPGTNTTVQVAENPKLGEILVDVNGMTLYSFEIDTPAESKCVAADCVAYWPPLTVDGKPQAGANISGEIATIPRTDGGLQVTYSGKPLYTFLLDEKPGETKGDGLNEFGGIWHAVTINGPSGTSDNNSGSKENSSDPVNIPDYQYRNSP